MRENERVAEHPVAAAPRRRRTLMVTVLAAITAGAALAAASGPGLASRPVSAGAVPEIHTGGPAAAPAPSALSTIAAPSATAMALAQRVATALAGVTAAVKPIVVPVLPGHGVIVPVRPVPAPCEAAGATQPSSAAVLHACPTPSPCAYFDGSASGSGQPRTCPPPPCYSTDGTASGSFAARPCPTPPPCAEPMASSPGSAPMYACPPPPPCNAASTNPSSPSGMVVRPCPPPCHAYPMAGTGASNPSTAQACPPPPPCEGPIPASSGSAMVVRPCPPPPSTLMLTEADSGKTFTVRAGTMIGVRLAAGGPMTWTAPRSSDGTVVTEIGASQDGKGGAGGSFHATKAGQADLTATENPNCRPQCMLPSRLWTVHIVVVA